MSALKDIVGQRFGKWTVLEKGPIAINGGNTNWLCRCDCGHESLVTGTNLKRGISKKCFECQKITLKENREENSRLGRHFKLPNLRGSFNKLYRRYQKNAANRSREFTFTKEEFEQIIQKNCHYCDGIPAQIIQSTEKSIPYLYNGIDRIDNNKGYTLENSVPCCGTCNILKGRLTYEQFIKQIQKIFKFIGSK